jgi:hypothetical protein
MQIYVFVLLQYKAMQCGVLYYFKSIGRRFWQLIRRNRKERNPTFSAGLFSLLLSLLFFLLP